MPRKPTKRKTKPKKEKSVIVKEEEKITTPPEPVYSPPPILTDRMLRYNQNMDNKICPICNYRPVVTMLRKKNNQGDIIYALYRCRKCNHRWEIDKR